MSDFYQWTEGATSSYHNSHSPIIGSANVPSFVFQSHRYSVDRRPWAYHLPIQTPGTYHCTLYFGETYPKYRAIDARVFSVSASGSDTAQTEYNIDVFRETRGDLSKYVTRNFVITATDMIRFDFHSIEGEAFVSAITCELKR